VRILRGYYVQKREKRNRLEYTAAWYRMEREYPLGGGGGAGGGGGWRGVGGGGGWRVGARGRFGQRRPWATCHSRSALFTSLRLVFRASIIHTHTETHSHMKERGKKILLHGAFRTAMHIRFFHPLCIYIYLWSRILFFHRAPNTA